MELLFFLQSGLLCSGRRWKFAFNKNGMFLVCVVVMYGLMCLTAMPWYCWLIPILCYLVALLVTLIVPNDIMTVGKGMRKMKFVVYAFGESQFGIVHDGIFLKVHRWHVEDIVPIKTYKRRFGDKSMMLVELQENNACYLYSEDYPRGLYLGFPLDEDMVVFQDRILHETFVVEPGRISRLFNVKSITQGLMVYSDFWNKATYYRSDAVSKDDEIDEFGFKELCYHYQVDIKHFFLVEFQDNWFKLFFVLLNKDNVVDVLDVRNVDVIKFTDNDENQLDLRFDYTKQMYFLA